VTQSTLYFIRHGETDWNRAGRLQGRLDIPINETGKSQARRNALELKEMLEGHAALDFIASPLLRARQTMEIVRQGLDLPPGGYRTDERLQEISFGAWEGMSWKELKESDRAAYDVRKTDPWSSAPPGGESYAEVTKRVVAWMAGMTRDSVVVSHGGISRCIRGIALQLPTEEIPHLEVPQDRIMIVRGASIDWV
jgi:probable phosphoglycerate mutase